MKLQCRTCGELFVNLPEWMEHSCKRYDADTKFDIVKEEGDYTPTVEPTPRLADEFKKILDNGWNIQLWANPLGSYSARAMNDHGKVIDTDDFEPLAALYRLTEKVFGRIV